MILITGGSGFLGLNLAWQLANNNKQVVLFDHRPIKLPSFLKPFWGSQVTASLGDLTDFPAFLSAIQNHSVESIIHAAYFQFNASGDKATVYQSLKGNLDATLNVLEASRIFSLQRVTFISSFSVYYGTKASVFHEKLDLPMPSHMDVQGIKNICEQLFLFYAKEYRLSITILRPDRLYGPLSHGRRFPIKQMIDNALAEKLSEFPEVFGGNKAPYTYIKDTAKGIALVHCAKAPKHILYNIGEGNLYTFSDFARAVLKVIPGAQIVFSEKPTEKDVDLPPFSVDRIKQEMGFFPDYDLFLAIKDYIDWLREERY